MNLGGMFSSIIPGMKTPDPPRVGTGPSPAKREKRNQKALKARQDQIKRLKSPVLGETLG